LPVRWGDVGFQASRSFDSFALFRRTAARARVRARWERLPGVGAAPRSIHGHWASGNVFAPFRAFGTEPRFITEELAGLTMDPDWFNESLDLEEQAFLESGASENI
tara:strand:- start:97 stop:414 length:318 start_codon:yes stop_codon:yes gene_type:complete